MLPWDIRRNIICTYRMIYYLSKGTITNSKINVCHKYLLSRVSNKHLTQSRGYCIYSVPYAQVVHERLRKEIEYCSKMKIGNRSPDCITKHIMKNVTFYIFTRCLVLKVFLDMLLSKLHCFSYFHQRPLNKYFVLCFYIQTKQKQRPFIDSTNYSRQYYFR